MTAWNVQRGMFRRELEIRELGKDSDILVLTETDNTNLSAYKIDNFKIFLPTTSNPNSKVRVMILVKEWLAPHVQLREDLMTEDFSSIWISISPFITGKRYNLCAFYREWNSNGNVSNSAQSERIQIFLEQIGKATVRNDRVLIMGDLNLCSNKWDDKNYPHKSLADEWRSGIAKYGMQHINLGSTYFSNHSDKSGNFAESALDHLYTNFTGHLIETKILPNSSTDHLPIQAKLAIKQKSKQKVILKRTMKKFNEKRFCRDLALQPWEKLVETEDVNKMVEMYTKFITKTLDNHAPFKEIKIRSKYKSGISSDTKKLMSKRDKARREHSKAKGNKKKELHENYRKLRNKCTTRIRKETIANSVRRIEKSQTPSEYWKIANEVINPRENKSITLTINGKDVTDEEKLCEEFKNGFLEKIEKLVEGTKQQQRCDPLSKLREQVKNYNLKFNLKTVSEEQILKIIKNLKNTNSAGTDSIPTKILKIAMEVLVSPITLMVNTSIVSGTYPDMWKVAKVIPVFKKGDNKSIKNYRPISILNTSSKILEEVVRIQVSQFFETNKLFPLNQHGFRPNRSTTTALIALQDTLIQNKAEGKTSGMLLWDLSAAFDTLDHEIFLDKLKIYGFDELACKWFGSYLLKRKQMVQVGSARSGEAELSWGSPQGAILSPLIFTIYIADIELWVEFADVFGYADDTSTVVGDVDEEEALKKLQKESNNILDFMNSNGLIANPEKTGLLIFRPNSQQKGKTSLKVGDAVVEEKEEEKLLGLIIDNKLKWNSHINDMRSKLNQRVALLRRLKQWLPRDCLALVAQGLVLSKIRYGLPVFGQPRLQESDPLSSHCRSLQITVNNIMRILTNNKLSDRVPIKELHASTGLPSLNQMVVQAILMETWKILNGKSGVSESIFQKVDGVTRAASVGELKLPKKRNGTGFVYNGAKIWNQTPTEIRLTKNLYSAKNKIKSFSKLYQ